MTIAGVTTTNVSNTVPVSDQVLVNRNGSTGLQTTPDLAVQLAGSGALAEQIASAKALATSVDSNLTPAVADHESRIDALEATAATGLHMVQAVATRTTANVNLASGGLAAGTTHGGYTVAAGDRVLVPSQTAGAENGIYIVPASGAAPRASDADGPSELSGISVKCLFGSYAGRTYACTTQGAITVGTTVLSFALIDDDARLTSDLSQKANAVRQDIGAREPGVVGGALKQARARDNNPRWASFDSNGGTRVQWLVAWKMGCDDRIDAVRVYLSDEGRAPVPATIEAVLYKQPAALASGNTPADISQYQLVDSYSAPVEQHYTVGGGFQSVTLPIKSRPFALKDERYVYVVRLRDASNNLLPFGFGSARHRAADEEVFAQGAFATSGSLTAFSGVSASNRIYGEVLSLRPQVPAKSTRRGLIPVDGRVKLSAWGVDFTRVVFSVRPPTGVEQPGGIGFYISQAAGVVYLRLRVFLRPYADGSYGTNPFTLGSGANDKAVYCRDYTASDLYDTSSSFTSEDQFVVLPFDDEMPAIGRDTIALFEVTAYASDRVTAATFRVSQAAALPAGEVTLLRGCYSTAASPSTVQVTGSTTHHYVLLAQSTAETAGHQDVTPAVDRCQYLDPVEPYQSTITGVVLPRMAVWTGDHMEIIAAQTVALSALPAAEVVTDALSMRYNQDNPLSGRWWGSMTVTRVSDSAVLTAGTDYQVYPGRGTIRGLQNIADTPVSIGYSAYRGRIDIITWFPDAGYQVWPGAPRLADPDNWRPYIDQIASNGRQIVAEVLVTNNGLEVIDKTKVRPGSRVIVGRELEVEAIREWNRHRLAPERLALQRGQGLTQIAYGDSISGWTGGWEPEWQTVPGGPSRDTKGALTIQTPDDSLANIGLPAVIEGDGIEHWYGSYHRRLQATLQSRYGVTIDFRNLGIGGTTAGSGGTGIETDRYGGSNPTRLAGLLAAKGATGLTMAIIGFATNEDDSEQMVNNLTTIGRYCRDNGITPILVGQPALAYGSTRTMRRQQRNDSRIVRAARSIACAYVPLSLVTHENRAASGIFRTLQATAGGVNHPGAYEHAIYAEWIDYLCFR